MCFLRALLILFSSVLFVCCFLFNLCKAYHEMIIIFIILLTYSSSVETESIHSDGLYLFHNNEHVRK